MALLEVVNTLFTDRSNYRNVTDKDKEDFFFIINRNIAKKYPLLSQKLNHKEIDKTLAMDVLFTELHRLNEARYNKWFWMKGKKAKDKDALKPTEIDTMMNAFNLDREEDLDLLRKWFTKEFKTELNYYMKLRKENA